jgi:hypothetical protein
MQLMVLGMHRSGTSVLARVLNLMGAWFGPEGIGTGANAENPKGFWERRDVRALNDYVLHSVSCDWNRVSSFDAESVPAEIAGAFRECASRLVLELDAHRPWFIKEPRLCLLLPLWRQVLEAPVCVHIHRHPVEVAGSLMARNGMPMPAGMALWEKYVTTAARASSGLPSINVLHHRLLANPVEEVERLHAELAAHQVPGLRMPSTRELLAFIDPSLHRQRRQHDGFGEYADDPRVRMFDAIGTGNVDMLSGGPLPERSLRALREYEAQLPPVPVPTGGPPQPLLRGQELEFRKLHERVIARDQENRLLREALARAENMLGQLEDRRARELVAQGELRARLERSGRDLNQATEQVQALQNDLAAANERARSAQEAFEDRNRRLGEYVAARRELKDRLSARSARVAELGAALEQARKDLDERFRELATVSRMLFDLEHTHHAAMATRDNELAQARRMLADMRGSRVWRMSAPLRVLGRRLRGRPGGEQASALAAIEGSGLFDRAWYLERNADVAESGIDPVEHYLGFGAAEGRDPGPGFSTGAYLERNPDVRESGVNPLVHYALHGKQEGRSPR